jgi:hypothetical protein
MRKTTRGVGYQDVVRQKELREIIKLLLTVVKAELICLLH